LTHKAIRFLAIAVLTLALAGLTVVTFAQDIHPAIRIISIYLGLAGIALLVIAYHYKKKG